MHDLIPQVCLRLRCRIVVGIDYLDATDSEII